MGEISKEQSRKPRKSPKPLTLERHGADFYKRIGAMGGKTKVKKGFAVSGKASEAGRLGGKISRRGRANAK